MKLRSSTLPVQDDFFPTETDLSPGWPDAWQGCRDTGAILLDMNPDGRTADNLRRTVESDGDTLADLHLWRLGPGHLGAIVSVGTSEPRDPDHYRAKLAQFRALSHLTIEVQRV